ncbi:hypothetical protein PQG44_00445 [Aquirufa sp. LEPPI-3A]|uniref:hypothetical protein n=1 Tax=Aquirufa regiilacus TaxID=3024868 RepID=UPI0028DFFB10|nr:hypothetical protein [Aquirufa sp. LEPPI-3A]MDT8886131.1 hypothetical protein [Aquirufa sp. LEPPI-3A]
MKKLLFLLSFSIIGFNLWGQSKSLNFQAVIQDPKIIDIPGQKISGQPLVKGKVWLKFDLSNAKGELDYSEIQATTTDEFGLVNLTIGQGSSQGISSNSIKSSRYSNFQQIVWDSNIKTLAVSVSFDEAKNFTQVSSQLLSHTAYALYAEAVNYQNVADAPTKLSDFSNDMGYLVPKDLNPLKSQVQEIQTQTQTQFLLVDQRITEVGNQLSSQAKNIASITNSLDLQNQKLADQQNQIQANQNQVQGQISNLTIQTNNTQNSVNNLGGTYESLSNKSSDISLGGGNPSNELYPSQRATKSYIDNSIYQAVGSGVPDATTLAAGKIQLAGDLAGTAAAPTVPALANKENNSNKSISVTTDASSDIKYPSVKAVKDYVDAATQGVALQTTVAGKEDISNKSTATALGTSDILYPSQKAVKTYVDNQISSATIVDADASTKGKIQLAGDLAGTAAAPTVPALANKENSSNKSISVSTDATSDIKYPSVKAVKSYVDNQISSATIVDADASTKGKIQLAGDLAGTAAAPTVIKINGVSLAGLSTGLLKNTTSTGIPSIAVAGTDYLGAVTPGTSGNILTSNGTTWISSAPAAGAASTLLNARLIYGNSFDGSANVSGIIASSFGGTGNGFTKFTGATGSEKTYTLPNADAVILTNLAAVAINQGGTGATNKTAAFDALSPMTSPGDIIYGISGGSAARLAKGSENQILTISNGLPAWTTSTATAQAQDSNEEFNATVSQTSFTINHTPANTSKLRMYINGIRISNTAYSISGTTVTYIPANNGAYDLAVGDRIQFDYQY